MAEQTLNTDIRIQIEQFLPHRAPMLMVDSILDISHEHVLCSFVIQSNNIFVEDNLLQEAGLMENMAQTCSSIVGQTFYDVDYNPLSDKRIIGFISGIKQMSVFKLPQVGQKILTEASLTSRFDGDDYAICTMLVTAKQDEERLSSAEINLFLQKQ
ncbi:hypothetical protein PQ465_19655 [Sphingobacterium oryzagri]|uniref:ABC transporter permease n=1 Tax=Sphingobacterium oryzagri TaxID=3025669 RepID=A0ABY7WH34_9SPHI|nr:hypothetical protein [Sphingobacterium sp. KACC 22765]WDF68498.1 hypothetical protein PQ465_19655 [Sphingobacterium sp. KACC 22765]